MGWVGQGSVERGSLGKRSFVQPEYPPPLTHGAIFAAMPYEKQRYSPDLMDQGGT